MIHSIANYISYYLAINFIFVYGIIISLHLDRSDIESEAFVYLSPFVFAIVILSPLIGLFFGLKWLYEHRNSLNQKYSMWKLQRSIKHAKNHIR